MEIISAHNCPHGTAESVNQSQLPVINVCHNLLQDIEPDQYIDHGYNPAGQNSCFSNKFCPSRHNQHLQNADKKQAHMLYSDLSRVLNARTGLFVKGRPLIKSTLIKYALQSQNIIYNYPCQLFVFCTAFVSKN